MVDVDVIVGVVSFRVRCQIVFFVFFVMLYLCTPLNTQMTPIIWWPAFGAPPLLIRSALSALDASCDCTCYDQPMMHRGCGRAVRTLRTFCDDRAAPSAPALYFLFAKQMTPIIW